MFWPAKGETRWLYLQRQADGAELEGAVSWDLNIKLVQESQKLPVLGLYSPLCLSLSLLLTGVLHVLASGGRDSRWR